MSDYCNICNTRRPEGGTQHLVLGDEWLEYCQPCGDSETLTNGDTGETLTIAEVAKLSRSCRHCDDPDIYSHGLCGICYDDHYS